MAKKLNADAITTAIYALEETTRKAALIEIRDELTGWAEGASIDEADLIPGLLAAAEFLTANYSL